MTQTGFDNQKYLRMQSARIQERIGQLGNKLYMEFGGKLFDDYHASRVLPGFEPDSKLKMLLQLKEQAEIIIVISANDIERNKMRGDYGITYEEDLLRLKTAFESYGLYVSSVVITRYTGQRSADTYRKRLQKMDIPVYLHYNIEGYPTNIPLIVSDDGYGKNEYIRTTRPLVVVTAPGPGSGKMAVCLSQLYHENKRGIKAGYAKYETFPIWNLPLKHPVNLAYEAATADLNDINMIDPFHMEAYGKTAVNYNRDIEVFPVLHAIFEHIYGSSPYQSPTDMGVNMAGFCITDDEVCRNAARAEIIRRYFDSLNKEATSDSGRNEVYKIEMIMKQAGISPKDRVVATAAQAVSNGSDHPAAAVALPDGQLFTASSTDTVNAAALVLLQAISSLAGIPDTPGILPARLLKPVLTLKETYLKSRKPQLNISELLAILSIHALENEDAKKALQQLPTLAGCDLHVTVQPSAADRQTLKALGLHITNDPVSAE